MAIITIPKELAKEGEIVLIPRREYERLTKLSKRVAPEVKLTPGQRRALAAGRRNKKVGNFLTFDGLKAKLGFTG